MLLLISITTVHSAYRLWEFFYVWLWMISKEGYFKGNANKKVNAVSLRMRIVLVRRLGQNWPSSTAARERSISTTPSFERESQKAYMNEICQTKGPFAYVISRAASPSHVNYLDWPLWQNLRACMYCFFRWPTTLWSDIGPIETAWSSFKIAAYVFYLKTDGDRWSVGLGCALYVMVNLVWVLAHVTDAAKLTSFFVTVRLVVYQIPSSFWSSNKFHTSSQEVGVVQCTL
jgi:hypothetical protein